MPMVVSLKNVTTRQSVLAASYFLTSLICRPHYQPIFSLFFLVISLHYALTVFTVFSLARRSSLSEINVKKTTVYTHVNGDRPSHIENSKIKSYITISLHIVIRQCAAV